MNSCIYFGKLRHRRFLPTENNFTYPVFQMLLDLDELDTLFKKRVFWSTNRRNIASFWRNDYLKPEVSSLKKAVHQLVKEKTGLDIDGPVQLLTHVRYFGYSFNPVSFYFCYSATQPTQLLAIVAEITNTPWKERHQYVLIPEKDKPLHFKFDKQFHVSPFMPMQQSYDWKFQLSEKHCTIHMENYEAQSMIFDATLTLKRTEISGRSLAWSLIRYPFMTFWVIFWIHLQALILWLKRCRVYTHPKLIKKDT